MERNNGQTIFLSVIGIATLLVAIIGATFAYFSTTITNNSVSTNVTTAKVVNAQMENTLIDLTNVVPGDSTGDKTVTVRATGIGAGTTMPYTCKISYSGQVTDLQYQVSAADAATNGGTWTAITTTDTNFVTGTLSSENDSDVYLLNVRFHETGSDQTSAQSGKSSVVSVKCSLDNADANGTVYYTTGATAGTVDEPSAQ